jgi:hypothetical protein
MRRVVVAVLLLLWSSIGPSSLLAQVLRVSTWQVRDCPSGKTTAGASVSPADEGWFERAAAVLDAADADVIIVYGIPDGDAAKKLAGLLKPRKYAVALHVGFRFNGPKGPFVGEPFAILSRKERLNSKAIEWGSTGRIDLPGGFAFATFRHGPSVATVCVGIMPGSLTNMTAASDHAYFSRKRGYAAQYLVHYSSWLATTYTNAVVATYLTGDIPIGTKLPAADECAKILDQAGFRVLSPGSAEDKTRLSITNGLHVDRVLDPIFTKSVDFAASRLVPRPQPEYPVVTCDLTLKAPASAAARKPPAAKPARPAPTPPAVPEAAASPVSTLAANAPEVAPVPAPAPAPTSTTPPAPAAAPRIEDLPALAVASPKLRRSDADARPAPSRDGVDNLGAQARAWLLPASVGASVLLLALVFVRPWRSRRGVRASIAAPASTPLANDAMFLEVRPAVAAAAGGPPQARSEPAGQQEVVLGPSPTATGNADEVLRRDRMASAGAGASASASAGPELAGHARVDVMPHLRRLMRDKLVLWLNQQRTQLLRSHEAGTAQVLDMQARLEQLKNQFQERLIAQQQRIAELDTALKRKETIIKDLLRNVGRRAAD